MPAARMMCHTHGNDRFIDYGQQRLSWNVDSRTNVVWHCRLCQ